MKYLKHPAVLFSLYVALVGGSYLPYMVILPVRISYHILMTGLLIWWIWRDGLPSTPLLWPLALTGVVTFISALNAIDPRIALENWWHILVNGLLGLMLVSWMRKGWGETLFRAHFWAGGAIIAVSALEWLLSPGQRVGGAFGLINLTGAYAAALIIPALAWFIVERRAWLLAIAVGLAGVVIMNDSRGAYISAVVAGIVFLLLRWRVKLKTLLVAGGVAAALGVGVFGISQQAGHAAGDVLRLDLWRSAAQMLKDHPLTGVGPGLFGQAYRTYRAGTDDNMTGAHDWYLNALAELGLPGALASVLTGFVFLKSINRHRTTKQDAILAALVGIGVHLLFDNFPATNFVVLVNLYAAYLVSGQRAKSSVVGLSLGDVSVDIDSPKLLAMSAMTGLLFFGFAFVFFDIAQIHYETSLRTNSISEARTASYIDSRNRVYAIQVARLEGDENQVHQIDPTLSPTTDLGVYGIISFGRILH
jgi:O-antigen ligase